MGEKLFKYKISKVLLRISANPSVEYDKNNGIITITEKFRQKIFCSNSGMWNQNETQSLWKFECIFE